MKRTTVILLFCICLLLFSLTVNGEEHDEEEHGEEEQHDEEETEQSVEQKLMALGITTASGMAAFIGALSIFCVKRENLATIPASLSFSSGVLVYLSFFNLYPEAIEQLTLSLDEHGEHEQPEEAENGALPHLYALLCLIGGLLIAMTMEAAFKYFGAHTHDHSNDPHNSPNSEDAELVKQKNPENAENIELPKPNEMVAAVGSNDGVIIGEPSESHSDSNNSESPKHLTTLSYSIAFALVLHHFPEGIATFISLYYDMEFGILVAIALAIHDIPSGICIAVPVYCASGSKWKPFVLCFIAFSAYPLGAFVGWIILECASAAFIDLFIGILLGITSGIMLYIAFVELLPTAISTAFSQNLLKLSISLLFAGMLVMDISNILLKAAGGHNH